MSCEHHINESWTCQSPQRIPIKTENKKILKEYSGNQSLTILFTSQTLWPYPMVLDTWLYITFTPSLWNVLWKFVCPFFLSFFFTLLTLCPVWVHTTSGFCMIGSYMGSRFACSSQNTTRLSSFRHAFVITVFMSVYLSAASVMCYHWLWRAPW